MAPLLRLFIGGLLNFFIMIPAEFKLLFHEDFFGLVGVFSPAFLGFYLGRTW